LLHGGGLLEQAGLLRLSGPVEPLEPLRFIRQVEPLRFL
jgi:hypothetical protein